MRFSATLLFILFLNATTYAQSTSYYTLIKKVQNGIMSTNVSGGQFISFLRDLCYESDKKGIGVGHGSLRLDKSYDNANYKFYTGSSYWGTNTIFKFKSDLSVLTILC